MEYKKIYKSIEKRYIIGVVILVLLLIGRQFAIQRQIDLGRDMSRIINISGRQRMLSQKISKDVLMVYENQDNEIKKIYIDELGLSLQIFEESHDSLLSLDDEEGFGEINCPVALKMFDEIDPYYEGILSSGYKFLELLKQEDYKKEEAVNIIRTITSNERVFLVKMDEIVLHYEAEGTENILKIEQIEKMIFNFSIFLVIFITLFIFIPATKTLRYAFIDINERNENVKDLFLSVKGSLFLVNKEGLIINHNKDAAKITKLKDGEIINSKIDTAVKWMDINIMNILKEVSSGKEFDSVEVVIEGENRPNKTLLLSVIKGKFSRKDILLISAFDITYQKIAEGILKDLAMKDELTGLYNRHFLESIIYAEIERSIKFDYPISVMILDIDDFKIINDTFGHPMGDVILRDLAMIIKNVSRESDFEIRIGGEEFVILMPHTNLKGAYLAAEKLRKIIENSSHPIVGKYTASFGVAERKNDENYFDLYSRMDDALYRAKSSGKNRVIMAKEDGQLKMEGPIKWNEKWNCGEKIIDSQHKGLVSLLGKISQETGGMEDKESIFFDLGLLISKIEDHFKYEERVLAKIGYKYLEEHKSIHFRLLEKTYYLKEQVLSGESSLQDLIDFMLNDVVIIHLLKEDTKFFPYISNK